MTTDPAPRHTGATIDTTDVGLVVLPCAVLDSDAASMPGVQAVLRRLGLSEQLLDLSAAVCRRAGPDHAELWHRAGQGVFRRDDGSPRLIADRPDLVSWCVEQAAGVPATHLVFFQCEANRAMVAEAARRIREAAPGRPVLVYGTDPDAGQLDLPGVPYLPFRRSKGTARWIAEQVRGHIDPEHEATMWWELMDAAPDEPLPAGLDPVADARDRTAGELRPLPSKPPDTGSTPLERECAWLVMGSDRGGYSSPTADPTVDLRQATASAVLTLGWMHVDLRRAVAELHAILELQRADGFVPDTREGELPATPLFASVLRRLYFAARERYRDLERPLSHMVPAIYLFHDALNRRTVRRLWAGDPRGEDNPERQPLTDVGFNALLVQAEADLAEVGQYTAFPTRTIVARRARLATALSTWLWWPERGRFAGRRGAEWRETFGPCDLLPLWCGAATLLQSRTLVNRYLTPGVGLWDGYPLLSRLRDDPDFDPATPNRGAVDPLTTWLLAEALARYGYTAWSGELLAALRHLAEDHGIWQAYDADNGRGVGEQSSPLTAAIILHIARTTPM